MSEHGRSLGGLPEAAVGFTGTAVAIGAIHLWMDRGWAIVADLASTSIAAFCL